MSFKKEWPTLFAFFETIAPVVLPFSHACFLAMVTSFLILCIPGALTKYVTPIHRIRCWLKTKLRYYWQLSLEGPLFKVIGRCGKLCCKARLASHCMVPKAFKVKVLSCTEFELAWTPLLPDNPFHEEFYIISYCQQSEDGEAGEWTERPLNLEDYHKREGEKKRKEIGRAERLRLNIGELPEATTFRLRVCSAILQQRSQWSSEVVATTFAKPSKDMGLTGPLATGAPTFATEYTWWQSKHEVGIWLAIPEEWKAKEISVKVTGTEIKIQHEKGILLAGSLGRKVRTDEVDWVLEEAGEHVPKGGKQLSLTLRKEKLMELWASFVDDDNHQKVDTKLLQLFYEGNSMNELASADLWE